MNTIKLNNYRYKKIHKNNTQIRTSLNTTINFQFFHPAVMYSRIYIFLNSLKTR